MNKNEAVVILLILLLVLGGVGSMVFVVNKVFTDCINSIPTVETVDQGVFNG